MGADPTFPVSAKSPVDEWPAARLEAQLDAGDAFGFGNTAFCVSTKPSPFLIEVSNQAALQFQP